MKPLLCKNLKIHLFIESFEALLTFYFVKRKIL